MTVVSDRSVRELLAALASIADAVRVTATWITSPDGASILNPELLSMLDQEQQIVGQLRQHA